MEASIPRGCTQQSFIQEGSNPRSDPLPFYTKFLTERLPLSYTFYWKMVPFHRPSLDLCIPFNCCKCAVFQALKNYKTMNVFLTFPQPWNTSDSPLVPFYRPKWNEPSHKLQLVKSLPFHRPEVWNRYPFQAETPRIGHYREYPSPRC